MKIVKSFSLDENIALELELISRIIGKNESKIINDLLKEGLKKENILADIKKSQDLIKEIQEKLLS